MSEKKELKNRTIQKIVISSLKVVDKLLKEEIKESDFVKAVKNIVENEVEKEDDN